MSRPLPDQMYDPRIGTDPLSLRRLETDASPWEPPRTNCFAVTLIETGRGTCWADAVQFPFARETLLFFVPYQHVRFESEEPIRGATVLFHANFLCVETFHAEAGCSGLLFNDPYGRPAVALDESSRTEVFHTFQQIRTEYQDRGLAWDEAILARLKLLLILAARIKSASQGMSCPGGAADLRHPLLNSLRDLIEEHYRTWHSPADYARKLHVTAKTLGRIVREELGTTPTDLIRNRILIHAKWQLLHTLRPVKEISRELGFHDELYFSRLFKKATGQSPTSFREFETIIRNGSNLSMPSVHAPILTARSEADT